MTASFAVAVATVAVIIASAVFLLAPRKGRTEGHRQIGRPLLTGAVVGLALMPAQYSTQAFVRSRDAQTVQKARQEDRRTAIRDQRQQLIEQINFSRDLRTIDLHTKDLHGLYLARRNLRHADLSHANLKNANLSYSDLRYAELGYANLVGANLDHARLDGSELERADFSGADLTHARIVKAHITETRFDRANMSHATLRPQESVFSDYNSFIATRMIRTHLRGVHLDNASFAKAFLYKVDLRGALLRHSSFRGAAVYESNASGADMCGAEMSNARIVGSTLLMASLVRTNWEGAFITTNSTLAGADLRKAATARLHVVSRLSSSNGNAGFDAAAAGYPSKQLMYRASASPSATGHPSLLARYGAETRSGPDVGAGECLVPPRRGRLLSGRPAHPTEAHHDLVEQMAAEGLVVKTFDSVARHFGGSPFVAYLMANACVRASPSMEKYCLRRARLIARLPRRYRWHYRGGRVEHLSSRAEIGGVRLGGGPLDIGNPTYPVRLRGHSSP